MRAPHPAQCQIALHRSAFPSSASGRPTSQIHRVHTLTPTSAQGAGCQEAERGEASSTETGKNCGDGPPRRKSQRALKAQSSAAILCLSPDRQRARVSPGGARARVKCPNSLPMAIQRFSLPSQKAFSAKGSPSSRRNGRMMVTSRDFSFPAFPVNGLYFQI